jgi:hypothetical protein
MRGFRDVEAGSEALAGFRQERVAPEALHHSLTRAGQSPIRPSAKPVVEPDHAKRRAP